DREPHRTGGRRLASGPVHVRRLHRHSVVVCPAPCTLSPAMTVAETESKPAKAADHPDTTQPFVPETRARAKRRIKVTPYLITLGSVVLAGLLGWATWNAYMEAPWTRDATVRAYIVTMAPEVAGRIVGLHVRDNEYVHKGDVLIEIDPTDFRIAVDQAEA